MKKDGTQQPDSDNRHYLETVEYFSERNHQLKNPEDKDRFLNYEIEATQRALESFPLQSEFRQRRLQHLHQANIQYLQYLLREKERRQGKQPEAEEKAQSNLTERLLIIHYLQQYHQFPVYNPQGTQTKKQFQHFIAVLLEQPEATIKKGMQRVEKIVTIRELTHGNRSGRLQQLKNVAVHFHHIGKPEIARAVELLIADINAR